LLFSGCSDKNKNEVKTVAFVSLSNVDDNTFSGFKTKMNDIGWIEGENINYIVAGAAKSVSNLSAKVEFVISKKPDMILVSSTPATQEVKKQNKNIPIVFCPVNDPIGAKILQNTNKPEGLITGVRLPVGDHKRTEWLYHMIPSIKKVFVPYSLGYQSSLRSLEDIKSVAKELRFNIVEKALDGPFNIDKFIQDIPSDIDAIILPRDSIIESQIEKFVEYSLKNKLPLSVPSYQQVQKGALYTFGFIHNELGKDAATIADKILKGVNVRDLPVKFGNAYLVVNIRTAKKIGLKLNNDVLNYAKMVVE
jgi:putative ABC transport system substrate-binding protein